MTMLKIFDAHCVLPAAALMAATAGPAFAQQENQQEKSFLHVTATGGLATTGSPIPGPLHSRLAVGISSSDYFRGAFDGVDEDLDSVAGIVNLATTVEVLDRPNSNGLTGISITAGTANGLTNGPAADEGDWYESDNYLGIAAELQGGWATGLTYTYYATPDIGGSDALQEVAAAVQYSGSNLVGQLAPQLKAAKPVDDSDGWFTQFSVQPSFQVAKIKAGPVKVAVPMAVGAGFDNYYGGPEGDTGIYGSAGAHLLVPLGIPKSYGNWTASAGVNTLLRDNTIQSAGGPLDDAGDLVVSGSLMLSVAY